MIRLDVELNGETWCRAGLQVGDEVRIRIVRADEADPPVVTEPLPPLSRPTAWSA